MPRELRHNIYFWFTLQIWGNRLTRKNAEEALKKLPSVPQKAFLQKTSTLTHCPFITHSTYYSTGTSTGYIKLLGAWYFKLCIWLGSKHVWVYAQINKWRRTGADRKINISWKKKLILLELAQQSHSWHSKNPQRAPSFSLSTDLAHVILASQIHIEGSQRKRGSMGLIPGSPKHHSTALLLSCMVMLADSTTAPVHLLQKALPSNSNQCWVSPSPFSWRLKHRSKVLLLLTDHIDLLIFLLVNNNNDNDNKKAELRTLAWQLSEV